MTCREAEECKRAADELAQQVEAVLETTRKQIAELQGQHEELSPEALHSLAKNLLQQWQQDARVDSVNVGIQGISP